MVTHVVLFRPRPTLTDSERQGLAAALTRAIGEIPSVRRARVGRRVTHGRGYEALMRVDYSHIALLEFDDVAGLLAYLAHPAHEDLGRRFFDTFDEALMYDYEVDEAASGIAKLL
jgi:hypothetical protein